MTNEKNKKRITSFSKGISIFSLIAIIFNGLAIGVLILCMAIIPFITKNISIEGNTLIFFEEKIEFHLTKEEILTIKHDGEVVESLTFEDLGVNEFTKVLQNLSSTKITLFLEMAIIFCIIEMIIIIVIFAKLHSIFEEITKKQTPFTKKIPDNIRFIAYTIITLILLDIVTLFITSLIFKIDLSVSIDFSQVLFIIILFVLSFIFEYGYEIENKRA